MAGNRPNGLRVVQRKEPKGANMKIIDGKLTLRCEDGTELKADITDANMPNSGKRVWWLCSKCGYEWEASIEGRNQGKGHGCRKCAMRIGGQSRMKPVVCIETGEVFESGKKAAEVRGVSRSHISRAIKCSGYHWRYADDDA